MRDFADADAFVFEVEEDLGGFCEDFGREGRGLRACQYDRAVSLQMWEAHARAEVVYIFAVDHVETNIV